MISRLSWNQGILMALLVTGIAVPLFIDPIPQNPHDHAFADTRTFLGIPNFFNVTSNLPFMIVGILGLFASRSQGFVLDSTDRRRAYYIFCIGVILVGVGSAYYHLNPTNATLVWDRLPMTVSFMALLAMIIADCVSQKLGKALLWPLIGIGVVSIGYWYGTELWELGDLRPYGVVQFLPMVLIPVMLSLFGPRSLRSLFLWATLGTYVLAKVVEFFDAELYANTGCLSGHSLKHIIAALATTWVILACQKSCLKFQAAT
ncbi:MAG: ceramidase domain-containing protein [Nitrospirae bacterium]|nr:ceramidase domain-containing protein [Nitrospirota bacterium]MDA1303363.1 ceramidase domain-containing protein [Nitrospirota bacterium]